MKKLFAFCLLGVLLAASGSFAGDKTNGCEDTHKLKSCPTHAVCDSCAVAYNRKTNKEVLRYKVAGCEAEYALVNGKCLRSVTKNPVDLGRDRGVKLETVPGKTIAK